MPTRVGTSGYNYPEWKGSFYPADLPASKMLPYYAGKCSTVEINYTFYRMPTPKLIAGWRAQVPFTEGVKRMLERIEDWRDAPVWNPLSIGKATESWFRYLEN